eukprot:s2037_g1.t1
MTTTLEQRMQNRGTLKAKGEEASRQKAAKPTRPTTAVQRGISAISAIDAAASAAAAVAAAKATAALMGDRRRPPPSEARLGRHAGRRSSTPSESRQGLALLGPAEVALAPPRRGKPLDSQTGSQSDSGRTAMQALPPPDGRSEPAGTEGAPAANRQSSPVLILDAGDSPAHRPARLSKTSFMGGS